ENDNRGHDVHAYNLLGAGTGIAGSRTRVWRTSVEDANRPYPGSHALNGVEIVPAAVLVNTFLHAAEDEDVTLTDVEMMHPLMTAERRQIQVVHEPPALRLAARTPAGPDEPEPAWLVHVTANVAAPGQVKPDVLPDADALTPIDPGFVHKRLATVGVPSTGFDWAIETLLSGDGVLRATVRTQEAGSWAPALDAVMSVAPCAFPGDPVLRMVVHIDEMVLTGMPPSTVIIDAAVDSAADDTVRALLADVDGRVVGHLTGLRYPVIDAPLQAEEDLGGPAESFAGLAPEDLRERVLPQIGAEIATVMRLAPEDLSIRRPLVEQGLDSVMTVMVRRRLEKRFGCRLPATLLWQQPTISAIADRLVELLLTAEPDAAAEAVPESMPAIGG
ncbi:phosphopantetheine-binding protein, partial [Acrocarpospora phusangensis]|uniref:phosphopantetheine-binding protein n=1 Tax=Acrocarpospora phusangensis TaxID=1070424 RepID=UPI0019524931